MKNIYLFYGIILILLFSNLQIYSQELYTVTGGEMIFSWANNIELTEEYQQTYPLASINETPVRFTVFLHLGQYLHMDFTNNLGIYTGFGIRNVGFITDEVLPTVANPIDINDYQDYKVVRRTYNAGIPLALKIGSFKDHLYFFGGAEIEWLFVAKQKWWNEHSRSGPKTKTVNWFPNFVQPFVPSVFGGVQFPGGFNVKFRYYLSDIFKSNIPNTNPLDIANLNRYTNLEFMLVSLSWHYKYHKKKKNPDAFTYETGKDLKY